MNITNYQQKYDNLLVKWFNVKRIQVLFNYSIKKLFQFKGIKNNLAYFQRGFDSFVCLKMIVLNNQTKLIKTFQTQNECSIYFLSGSCLLLLLYDEELHMMEFDNNYNWSLKTIIQFKIYHPLTPYRPPKIAKWNLDEDFLAISFVNQYFLVKNSENVWQCQEVQNRKGKFLEVISNKQGTVVIQQDQINEKIILNKIDKKGNCYTIAEIAINMSNDCPSCILYENRFVLFQSNVKLITVWEICLRSEKITKLRELNLSLKQVPQQISSTNNIQCVKPKDFLLVQNLDQKYIIIQKNETFYVGIANQLPKINTGLIKCHTGDFLFSIDYYQKEYEFDCKTTRNIIKGWRI